MGRNSRVALFLVLIFLLPLASNAETQEGVSLVIVVDWENDWWTGELENNYLLQFSDDRDYSVNATVIQTRNGTESVLPASLSQTTSSDTEFQLVVNSSLVWGDLYTLSVIVESVDGINFDNPLIFERSFSVGTWGQAIDDHEVTTTNTWSLEQFQDENSTLPSFDLQFTGNGWQQRIGNTLDSWELGDGVLTTMGNSSGQDMDLNLVFDNIWNNQTSVDGVVTSQIIEARGYGFLDINSTLDGTLFDLDGNVSQAWYNRTMLSGIVDEQTILEASGFIYIDDSTNESSTVVEGEISTIYIETHDYNGSRIYDHQQIEGSVDFIFIEEIIGKSDI